MEQSVKCKKHPEVELKAIQRYDCCIGYIEVEPCPKCMNPENPCVRVIKNLPFLTSRLKDFYIVERKS